jgi:fatty-acid desaturase
MSELLDRFSLEALKFDYQVLAGMIMIWLIVLVCALHSLYAQGLSRSKQITWFLVMLLLPIVGVLIYLPFSFRIENYPDLFIWKRTKSATGKKG